MRRHYTNYLKGLPKIKKHRMKLVTQKFYEEIEESRNQTEAIIPVLLLNTAAL